MHQTGVADGPLLRWTLVRQVQEATTEWCNTRCWWRTPPSRALCKMHSGGSSWACASRSSLQSVTAGCVLCSPGNPCCRQCLLGSICSAYSSSLLLQAFYLARTGRPGPVLVDVPKDIQQQLAVPDWGSSMAIAGYMSRLPPPPQEAQLQKIVEALHQVRVKLAERGRICWPMHTLEDLLSRSGGVTLLLLAAWD